MTDSLQVPPTPSAPETGIPSEADLAASLESIGDLVKGLTEQVEECHGPIQALAGAMVTVMQCIGKMSGQGCAKANLEVEFRAFRDQVRPILPRVDEYLPMAEPTKEEPA